MDQETRTHTRAHSFTLCWLLRPGQFNSHLTCPISTIHYSRGLKILLLEDQIFGNGSGKIFALGSPEPQKTVSISKNIRQFGQGWRFMLPPLRTPNSKKEGAWHPPGNVVNGQKDVACVKEQEEGEATHILYTNINTHVNTHTHNCVIIMYLMDIWSKGHCKFIPWETTRRESWAEKRKRTDGTG